MEKSDNLYFLGVDTSNYTTSLAVVECLSDGQIVSHTSVRKLLSVGDGERGLRQSEAHFQHTKQIPELAKELFAKTGNIKISAVACSDKPRNAEGSYMPCFLAGVSAASLAADALGVPLYRFSHQCMHIASALYITESYDLFDKPHLAYHVSGGTTELVHVTKNGSGFDCKIIGGTLDISAGQLIDRVGVLLGIPFPCGAELERIASDKEQKVKTCTNGTQMNLSGAENILATIIKSGASSADVARCAIDMVKHSLYKTAKAATEIYKDEPVVFVGGVSGNNIIKDYISNRMNAVFACGGLSSDNAVGTAVLAARAYFAR